MSAIMTYRRLTADQLLHLRQNPDTVLEWLAQEEESDSPGTNLSWDTDVMWHILHFVLNQEVWGGKKPLWNAVLGGKPFVPGVIVEDRPGHFLTDENAIWESARFLTRDEVKEIATALDAIETEWLRARFDISAIHQAGIYGGDVFDDSKTEDEHFQTHLIHVFYGLKRFVNMATQTGDQLLIHLG